MSVDLSKPPAPAAREGSGVHLGMLRNIRVCSVTIVCIQFSSLNGTAVRVADPHPHPLPTVESLDLTFDSGDT